MPDQPGEVRARMISLTPQKAEQLLARNTHNRRVTQARVEQYAADMRKGDWQLNGEAIKISADGQILDGQHRLLAILEADVAVTTLVITGLPVVARARARRPGDRPVTHPTSPAHVR